MTTLRRSKGGEGDVEVPLVDRTFSAKRRRGGGVEAS
jgi:hypothetical protein